MVRSEGTSVSSISSAPYDCKALIISVVVIDGLLVESIVSRINRSSKIELCFSNLVVDEDTPCVRALTVTCGNGNGESSAERTAGLLKEGFE